MLLVAAGLLVYHPRTFLQLPIVRNLTVVYALTTRTRFEIPRGTLLTIARGPTTTSDEPDIQGEKLILEELKKTNSRLGSDLQALDSWIKSVEQTHLSYLTRVAVVFYSFLPLKMKKALKCKPSAQLIWHALISIRS